MWWILWTSTVRAECDSPTPREMLDVRIGEAEAAWVTWATSTTAEGEQAAALVLEAARREVETALACAPLLTRGEVGRLHVLFGLMVSDDSSACTRSFGAARRADPLASCPAAAAQLGLGICADLHDPPPMPEAPACGDGLVVLGELWVDGAPAQSLPLDAPAIAQQVRAERITTQILVPGAGLPVGWCVPADPGDAVTQELRRARHGGPVLLALGTALTLSGVVTLAVANDIYNPENCAGASGREACAEALSVAWSDSYADSLLATRDRGRDLRYGIGGASATVGVAMIAGGAAWTRRAAVHAGPTPVVRGPHHIPTTVIGYGALPGGVVPPAGVAPAAAP